MLQSRGLIPLYQQLKQQIRQAIESGAYPPNTAIPAERELIAQYGVSRITVRQAITDLVTEGLLYRRHGSGTFVAPPQVRPIAVTLSKLTGHVEELQLRGYEPRVLLLELGRAVMPSEVARALEREEGAEGWHLRRLVSVDGQPLMILDGYLPLDLGLSLTPEDLQSTPIPLLLEKAGVQPEAGALQISARVSSPEEAAALGTEPGAALLLVTRVIRTAHAHPIEWSQALYRSDRYHYEVELRRR